MAEVAPDNIIKGLMKQQTLKFTLLLVFLYRNNTRPYVSQSQSLGLNKSYTVLTKESSLLLVFWLPLLPLTVNFQHNSQSDLLKSYLLIPLLKTTQWPPITLRIISQISTSISYSLL